MRYPVFSNTRCIADQTKGERQSPPDEHPPGALEKLSTNPTLEKLSTNPTARVGNSPSPETTKPAAVEKSTAGDSKPAAAAAAAAAKGTPQQSPSKKRPLQEAARESKSHKKQPASMSGSEQLTFPERLMELINDTIAPEHVGWIEEEEAISFKTDGFQEHVLDSFFQGLKYDSFVRKLNRWYVSSVSSVGAQVLQDVPFSPAVHLLTLMQYVYTVHHRGFRRVTSERVPSGCVAYYHNSFRKDEQHLLSTMGIGKKNDPTVHDMQAFGGEQSMIGSASAAAAAATGGGATRETIDASAYTALASPITQRPNLFSGVASPTAVQSSPYSISSFTAAASLPSSSIQESKSDVANRALLQAGVTPLDSQQMLLEAMLARQRQTDRGALQQALLAESLRHQQSHQQQRTTANAALATGLVGRNDDVARQLSLLAAQSNAFGNPQAAQRQHFQPQQLALPSQQGSHLSSDPALALFLQDYLQRPTPSTNPMIPGAASLVNPNPLANMAAANAGVSDRATGTNAELESLVQALLEERRRREGQGPGPHR